MAPTAVATLGFAASTIFLVMALGVVRTDIAFVGKKKANEFRPSGDDLVGFPARLTRAHANCYENLPIAGAVLLYAIATNQSVITDGLALTFLGARVLQSMTHLASTSRPAVLIRFFFYIVQTIILIYWTLKLTHLI